MENTEIQTENTGAPNIDHLDDAIIDGKFCVEIDKPVIIERYVDYGEKMWLDTKTYNVIKVDNETGAIRLFDIANRNFAYSNFKNYNPNLMRFKIPSNKKISKVKGSITQKLLAKTEQKLRRVYQDKDGSFGLSLKGVTYEPRGATKAKNAMRLKVSLPMDEEIFVQCEEEKWSEKWYLRKRNN